MKKLSVIPILFLVLVAKIVPFNWIVGSSHAFFSYTTMMAPVVAKQFGFSWIFLFLISKKICSLSFLFFSLLHKAPLLFAARAYQQRHWLTSLFLPALCMLLFMFHNTGSVAWGYSLFWLIPMMMYFVADCAVARALTSSFVAHAVGSVVWLYTTDMSSSMWLALIPVVMCERLLMAGGILGFDFLIAWIKSFVGFSSMRYKVGKI